MPDLQLHSPAMGQKDGVLEERRSQKWTAAVNLQPTISKFDILLGNDGGDITGSVGAVVATIATIAAIATRDAATRYWQCVRSAR